MEKSVNEAIDLEWVELMVHAKRLGLTIEEIREFFKKEVRLRERAVQ